MGRDGRHRRCWRLPGIGRVRPARAAGANATHEGTALPAVTPVPPGQSVLLTLLRSPAQAGVSHRLKNRIGVQAGVPSCHQLVFT